MKLKLQPMLVIVISAVIVVLLLLQSLFISFSVSDIISEGFYDTSVELLEQKNIRLNDKLDEIRGIALSIAVNDEIIDGLSKVNRLDKIEQIHLMQNVSDIFSNITNTRNDNLQIFIISDNMPVYNYAYPNGVFESDYIKDELVLREIGSKLEGIIATQPNYMRNSQQVKYVTTYYRRIVGKNMQFLGTLCILIDENDLVEIVQDNIENKSRYITYVIDDEGDLITPYSDQVTEESLTISRSLQEMKIVEDSTIEQHVELLDKDYMIINTQKNKFGFRIIQLLPYDQVNNDVAKLIQNLLKIGMTGCFIAVVFLLLFSRSITRPVNKLIKQMDQVGSEEFDFKKRTGHIFEIDQLYIGFRRMAYRIQNLLFEIEQKHHRMRQAELAALQSQINPHFLYNTLDAINWMAIRAQEHDISNMVSYLGKLFRLSLNKGKDFTTIEYEVEHLRTYMKIQGYRYNNRFEFIEEYQEHILPFMTVKLILQPLVENCLVHGLSKTKGEGTIMISSKVTDGDITFIITDNGCGVDTKIMNERINNDSHDAGGYGVKNVHERIKLHFGDKYGLCYIPVEKGTKVEIRIPKMERSEVSVDV